MASDLFYTEPQQNVVLMNKTGVKAVCQQNYLLLVQENKEKKSKKKKFPKYEMYTLGIWSVFYVD